MRDLSRLPYPVTSLAFSADSRLLAVGRSGADVLIFDLHREAEPAEVTWTEDATRVAFIDGLLRATDGSWWAAEARPPSWRASRGVPLGYPDGVALMPAGRLLMWGHGDLRCWLPTNGRTVWRAAVGHALGAAVTPDYGRVLASMPITGAVLWQWRDAETGTPLGEPRPVAAGRLACFSPDARLVVTLDGPAATVWDAESYRREVTLDLRDAGRLRAAIFSPDGRTLALAGEDGLVRPWNVGDWRAEGAFDFGLDGRAIRALAFAPDGSLGAAGGDDGRLVLWDAG